MSGTNRVVLSSVTKKGGNESVLAKALLNANEEAIKEEGEKKKKKK